MRNDLNDISAKNLMDISEEKLKKAKGRDYVDRSSPISKSLLRLKTPVTTSSTKPTNSSETTPSSTISEPKAKELDLISKKGCCTIS
ncbi:MAG: hypothetical protein SFV53_03130 [Rickettsiales bacterium]|nr:hypothetical protein [Rickettsiales bacterium]